MPVSQALCAPTMLYRDCKVQPYTDVLYYRYILNHHARRVVEVTRLAFLLLTIVFGEAASGRSLVQWSPSESGVSECDREASMRRPCPLGDVALWKRKSKRPVSKRECVLVIMRNL